MARFDGMAEPRHSGSTATAPYKLLLCSAIAFQQLACQWSAYRVIGYPVTDATVPRPMRPCIDRTSLTWTRALFGRQVPGALINGLFPKEGTPIIAYGSTTPTPRACGWLDAF